MINSNPRTSHTLILPRSIALFNRLLNDEKGVEIYLDHRKYIFAILNIV
jgi:hypothetical protein